jgi:hypothetical protein
LAATYSQRIALAILLPSFSKIEKSWPATFDTQANMSIFEFNASSEMRNSHTGTSRNRILNTQCFQQLQLFGSYSDWVAPDFTSDTHQGESYSRTLMLPAGSTAKNPHKSGL